MEKKQFEELKTLINGILVAEPVLKKVAKEDIANKKEEKNIRKRASILNISKPNRRNTRSDINKQIKFMISK